MAALLQQAQACAAVLFGGGSGNAEMRAADAWLQAMILEPEAWCVCPTGRLGLLRTRTGWAYMPELVNYAAACSSLRPPPLSLTPPPPPGSPPSNRNPVAIRRGTQEHCQ